MDRDCEYKGGKCSIGHVDGKQIQSTSRDSYLLNFLNRYTALTKEMRYGLTYHFNEFEYGNPIAGHTTGQNDAGMEPGLSIVQVYNGPINSIRRRLIDIYQIARAYSKHINKLEHSIVYFWNDGLKVAKNKLEQLKSLRDNFGQGAFYYFPKNTVDKEDVPRIYQRAVQDFENYLKNTDDTEYLAEKTYKLRLLHVIKGIAGIVQKEGTRDREISLREYLNAAFHPLMAKWLGYTEESQNLDRTYCNTGGGSFGALFNLTWDEVDVMNFGSFNICAENKRDIEIFAHGQTIDLVQDDPITPGDEFERNVLKELIKNLLQSLLMYLYDCNEEVLLDFYKDPQNFAPGAVKLADVHCGDFDYKQNPYMTYAYLYDRVHKIAGIPGIISDLATVIDYVYAHFAAGIFTGNYATIAGVNVVDLKGRIDDDEPVVNLEFFSRLDSNLIWGSNRINLDDLNIPRDGDGLLLEEFNANVSDMRDENSITSIEHYLVGGNHAYGDRNNLISKLD